MPQSHAQIYLHVVFSMKLRRPFLQNRELRLRMHSYMGGIINGSGCSSIRVGGVEDHVHCLTRFSRTISVADFIRDLKKDSSKWVKDSEPRSQGFQWLTGYGAFSLSPSHVDGLVAYIENQEEHHRQETFQDELRRLMLKYGIEWDEQYVWD